MNSKFYIEFFVCFIVIIFVGCKKLSEHCDTVDKLAYHEIAGSERKLFSAESQFSVQAVELQLRQKLINEQGLSTIVGDVVEETIELTNDNLEKQLVISLQDALQIGAASSREYQNIKENVFLAALRVIAQKDEFKHTFAGAWDALVSGNRDTNGVKSSFSASWNKRLQAGASLSSRLVFDLAKLLSNNGHSAFGVVWDSSISIPLLSGSTKEVVMESVTQAERELLYALYKFSRFRRSFAVRITEEYLVVLQQEDKIKNAAENYKSLIASARRARRLADFGRIPGVAVDEAAQDELKARNRWIGAKQNFQSRLDRFKVSLGLPPDARVVLQIAELQNQLQDVIHNILKKKVMGNKNDNDNEKKNANLTAEDESGVGPWELAEKKAIRLALQNRQDLKISKAKVEDALRKTRIIADSLRAKLDLLANARIGESRSISSANAGNVQFNPKDGDYSLGLNLKLPWEKTAEQIRYRTAILELQRNNRMLQEQEDKVKLDIRAALRKLQAAREGLIIQTKAVKLAERRVRSTTLLLNVGRAQMRDLLFAQDSLLVAQNSLTGSLLDYRIAELELQRDMGILTVSKTGILKEIKINE